MADKINDNAAWWPEPDEQQKAEQASQQAREAASLPVIEDVIKWFDAHAELYSSIDAISVSDNTSAEEMKVAILVAKKMRTLFQVEASRFRSDYAKYLEKKEADG